MTSGLFLILGDDDTGEAGAGSVRPAVGVSADTETKAEGSRARMSALSRMTSERPTGCEKQTSELQQHLPHVQFENPL